MISQPSCEKRSGGTTCTTTAMEKGWRANAPSAPRATSKRSTTGSTVAADVKLTPVGFAVALVTANAGIEVELEIVSHVTGYERTEAIVDVGALIEHAHHRPQIRQGGIPVRAGRGVEDLHSRSPGADMNTVATNRQAPVLNETGKIHSGRCARERGLDHATRQANPSVIAGHGALIDQ